MKALSYKIKAHTCVKHNEIYCFMCIENICKHENRLLCSGCVNLSNTKGLVHIQNLFNFFETQQVDQVRNMYQCQAKLWQQFLRCKEEITETLDQLESLIEISINSLFGNETIKFIENNFFEIEINKEAITSLGSQLDGKIVLDENGHYNFPQKVQLEAQEGYLQSSEILKVSKEALLLMNGRLGSSVINQKNDLKIEQAQIPIIPQDIPLGHYQTNQTIPLDSSCNWLCFNHDHTQIAAAVDKVILIFYLSKGVQWIKDEQILVGHKSVINSIKFNHNTTQIASCSADNKIITWKQLNEKWSIHNTLEQQTKRVQQICYNHDSTILASCNEDKVIHIYTLNNNNWQSKQQLTQHKSCVNDICFNHDGTILASGSSDKSIILWQCNNVGNWELKIRLEGHTNSVSRVSFNSKSTQLVSGSYDCSIKIWSAEDKGIWKCLNTLIGHTNTVRSVYFNQQSNMIVSSSSDKSIMIWKIDEQYNWEQAQIMNAFKDQVLCAIINSDSQMIITGSKDNMIMIHKQQNNNQI